LYRHDENYNATNPAVATTPVEQVLYDTIPENPQTDSIRRFAANVEIVNHTYEGLMFANQLSLNNNDSRHGMGSYV